MTTTLKLAGRFLDEKQRMGRITQLTAVSQRQTLRGFADIQPNPSKIGRRTMLKWFDSVQHLEPATRRTRFSVVRGFCRWLVLRGVIKKDPTAEFPTPKVPRPVHRDLTRAQADALLAACQDETDMLIVALGFGMGLRRAEMALLELGDICLIGPPTMTVRGKGNHHRRIPIPLGTLVVLERYLAARQVTAGPLIRLRRYPERGVQPVWIGRRFSELAYRAKIKTRPRDAVSHHSMRHSLATRLWVTTGDAVLVADVLGHQDLGQLRRYVHSMDTERMRAALDGLKTNDAPQPKPGGEKRDMLSEPAGGGLPYPTTQEADGRPRWAQQADQWEHPRPPAHSHLAASSCTDSGHDEAGEPMRSERPMAAAAELAVPWISCHLPDALEVGFSARMSPRDSRIITQQGGREPPQRPEPISGADRRVVGVTLDSVS